MNKRPVSYLQTDPRWAGKPYRVPGESATIGGSGCGPTAAAMLIETLTGKTFTPVDACQWSMEHGYKALGQGTYYGYFEPQFAAFGIDCRMLNWQKTYGKPDHPNHTLVADRLREGWYAIALMKKGLWTRSGHFVVLWHQDDKVRINDPASTRDERVNGDVRTFRSQAQYYWLVDGRAHNGDEEDEDMSYESWKAYMERYLQERGEAGATDWPGLREDWAQAVAAGITVGSAPQAWVTKEQAASMILRAGDVRR